MRGNPEETRRYRRRREPSPRARRGRGGGGVPTTTGPPSLGRSPCPQVGPPSRSPAPGQNEGRRAVHLSQDVPPVSPQLIGCRACDRPREIVTLRNRHTRTKDSLSFQWAAKHCLGHVPGIIWFHGGLSVIVFRFYSTFSRLKLTMQS